MKKLFLDRYPEAEMVALEKYLEHINNLEKLSNTQIGVNRHNGKIRLVIYFSGKLRGERPIILGSPVG